MRTKFRGRLLLGMLAGALMGFILPYENIEHHNRVLAEQEHFLHIVNGAIIGTFIGILLDLRSARISDFKRYSLRQLFLIVAIAAVTVWAAMGYLALGRFPL